MRIYLKGADKAQLKTWAQAHYPHESCGLLVGEKKGDTHHVSHVKLTENQNKTRAQDRFIISPQDYDACEEDAEALGLSIIGVWHTHPDHPAKPSITDQNAAFPHWSYLILSVGSEKINDIQSYRLINNQFSVEEIIDAKH